MEKFKENKIAKILSMLTVVFAITVLISAATGPIFKSEINLWICLISLILTVLFDLSEKIFSDKTKYTAEFIDYINDKIQNAKTLDEYIEIRKEFISLAVENNDFCLSYPRNLNQILNNLNVIINSLKKLDEYNNK